MGFSAVCLIDSDSPTVPQHAYSEARHGELKAALGAALAVRDGAGGVALLVVQVRTGGDAAVPDLGDHLTGAPDSDYDS